MKRSVGWKGSEQGLISCAESTKKLFIDSENVPQHSIDTGRPNTSATTLETLYGSRIHGQSGKIKWDFPKLRNAHGRTSRCAVRATRKVEGNELLISTKHLKFFRGTWVSYKNCPRGIWQRKVFGCCYHRLKVALNLRNADFCKITVL